MKSTDSSGNAGVWVAIDVAKKKHVVLVESRSGRRQQIIVSNGRSDFERLLAVLNETKGTKMIGLEPTADYHRPIGFFLQSRGFDVRFVSSLAVARTREARCNSWDKNDPKDAQVILHLMKTGLTMRYYDPVLNGVNDLQEISNTYFQLSLRKTRLQHSLLNHYLAIYFPEAERFLCSSRAHWFGQLLLEFPLPTMVRTLEKHEFIKQAWPLLASKTSKTALLSDYWECATESIGVPIESNSPSVAMFKLIIAEHLELSRKRKELEALAHRLLADNDDYRVLRTVPGFGPVLALTVLAEAGDLRRFDHERQFLKFCGLDLATHQSGTFRGASKLSKRGNARLRRAFWMAGTVAIRMRENSFRRKFQRYVRTDPENRDLKRKGYTAVMCKMARVAYHLVLKGKEYRPYFEQETVPSGRTRSSGP